MAESLRAAEAGGVGASPDQPRWYACYTRARHEKQVDRLLRERGFESFLPLIPRVSQWKDRKRLVEWPLFPSYVFGRFGLADVHTVLATPGVASLVRTSGRPAAIADEELANVRLLLRGLATGAGQPHSAIFILRLFTISNLCWRTKACIVFQGVSSIPSWTAVATRGWLSGY